MYGKFKAKGTFTAGVNKGVRLVSFEPKASVTYGTYTGSVLEVTFDKDGAELKQSYFPVSEEKIREEYDRKVANPNFASAFTYEKYLDMKVEERVKAITSLVEPFVGIEQIKALFQAMDDDTDFFTMTSRLKALLPANFDQQKGQLICGYRYGKSFLSTVDNYDRYRYWTLDSVAETYPLEPMRVRTTEGSGRYNLLSLQPDNAPSQVVESAVTGAGIVSDDEDFDV